MNPVVLRAADTLLDSDNDGLGDYDELHIYHTDPANADTDGDGYGDAEEVRSSYSPLVTGKRMEEVDSDQDSLNDALEIALGTDLGNADSDGDGINDGTEAYAGFNPLKGNSDRSLSRHVEVDLTTQQLSYFLGDVKLGSFGVSTGVLAHKTPTGEFAILRKVPSIHYVGANYDYPNTKWNLEFKRSYYLHGAYWHKQFGIRPMSHGCVNIAYKDVQGLYGFLDVGDKVKIVGKTPARVTVAAKT